MTELDKPNQPEPTMPDPAGSPYSKGDVLHPEWGERPTWFSYIGVGIAIGAMVVGIALMILFAIYGWSWIQS